MNFLPLNFCSDLSEFYCNFVLITCFEVKEGLIIFNVKTLCQYLTLNAYEEHVKPPQSANSISSVVPFYASFDVIFDLGFRRTKLLLALAPEQGGKIEVIFFHNVITVAFRANRSQAAAKG